MTETAATKQSSAFSELMDLLDRMAKAKQKAYKELEAATAAQKEAQKAWNDAEFALDAGIVEEADVKKAKKALEQANERLQTATARFEASNRAGALESITQNEKVQALVAKAIEEADAELTKHEQAWTAEIQNMEELKKQYLDAAKRFFELHKAAGAITKQLQRVNEVVPGAVPGHLFSAHRRGAKAPWQLAIDGRTIDQHVHSKQSR
jgi:predicted  nucleic acid-binding Zn-ribbon protein